MNKLISVIIPNYNGSSTIGKCLESAFSSKYDNFKGKAFSVLATLYYTLVYPFAVGAGAIIGILKHTWGF